MTVDDRADNNNVWAINPSMYPLNGTSEEQLAFLIRFAVLAPSSHNSQPWRFTIDGYKVVIAPNGQRALMVSDPTARELYISIGTALENLIAAAACFGRRGDVTVKSETKSLGTGIAVDFRNSIESPKNSSELLRAMTSRHTNRNEYQEKAPDENLISFAMSLASPATDVRFISIPGVKKQLADIMIAAAVKAMDNRSFRIELSHYLIPNNSTKAVGMPGYGFGMPNLASSLAPWILPFVNINKLNAAKDLALLAAHTPMVGIISTTGDSPEHWIEAGRIYEKITLLATEKGMHTHPMAAAVEIGDYYREVQKVALIPTDFRTQVIFRLGYAKVQTLPSPRMLVEEVLR